MAAVAPLLALGCANDGGVTQPPPTDDVVYEDPNFDLDDGPLVVQGIVSDELLASADITLRVLSELDQRGASDAHNAHNATAFRSAYGTENFQLESASTMWARASRLVSEMSTRSFEFMFGPQNKDVNAAIAAFGAPDAFVTSPEISVDDLEIGDIIVTSTPSQISQLIQVATWSYYSHAMLYVGDGRVIEATGDGVEQNLLIDAQRQSWRVGVMRVQGLDQNDQGNLVVGATQLLGLPYNFAGLGAFGTQRITCMATSGYMSFEAALACLRPGAVQLSALVMDTDALFCSQVITRAYEHARLPLFENNGASPGDLVRAVTDGLATRQITIVGRLPALLEIIE